MDVEVSWCFFFFKQRSQQLCISELITVKIKVTKMQFQAGIYVLEGFGRCWCDLILNAEVNLERRWFTNKFWWIFFLGNMINLEDIFYLKCYLWLISSGHGYMFLGYVLISVSTGIKIKQYMIERTHELIVGVCARWAQAHTVSWIDGWE